MFRSSPRFSELRSVAGRGSGTATKTSCFPSLEGAVLSLENLRRRVLRPAAEEAGAAWAGFHTFRHTRAAILFDRGLNLKQVQRWLGHHSPSFTLDTYVHLLDERLLEPVNLTDELGVSVLLSRESRWRAIVRWRQVVRGLRER